MTAQPQTVQFWTLTDMEGKDPVTLCDSCALEATNMGARGSSVLNSDFNTMEEAAAVMTALLATIGVDFGISSSLTGECEECGKGAA